MQVNHLIITSRHDVQVKATSGRGKVGSWVNRMFGCWHKEMSRPFSNLGQTYRTCLNCGARRQFNLGHWKMQGGFYYNLPTTKHFRVLNGMPVAQIKTQASLSGISHTSRQCA